MRLLTSYCYFSICVGLCIPTIGMVSSKVKVKEFVGRCYWEWGNLATGL